MKKNGIAEVPITDMNSLGYGVGRLDGKAVFVPGAAPGDRMTVKIIKDAGRYFVGRSEELLSPSPDRVPVDCPAFPRCGGCAFRHISYEAEKKIKEGIVAGFFLKEGLDVPVLPILSTGADRGYRNKIQYPYKDGALGYYAPHSHRIVQNGGCLLHHPAAEKVIAGLKGYFAAHPVAGYDETTGEGLLRHVYLRTNRAGSEMLLTLVINGRSFPHADGLISFLRNEHPEVKGVYLNINEKNTNVILGGEYRLLWGASTIVDELLSCSFELSPASFYQVNHDACELLYGEVIARAGLRGGETVADLFCGVGTIGICLMKRAPADCRLVGVEIVPQAVEDARQNAARNGIENAEFIVGDANHPALQSADLVIVDPPRKGLDEALTETLSAMPALRKIIYVSCGPDTLARDLKRFAARGWTIGPAQPVDMFPRTGHCEVIALITRQPRIEINP